MSTAKHIWASVSKVALRIERSHKQCAPFIKKSNHVIANYSMLDSFSRCKLHTSFCMSLYGSGCGITTVDLHVLKKFLLLGERQ